MLSWLPELGRRERENMLLPDVSCAEHAMTGVHVCTGPTPSTR